MSKILVKDIVSEVVKTVSVRLIPQLRQYFNNLTEITFLHGHPIEIIQTLQERDKSTNSLKYKRYPLIALFQDIQETPGSVSNEVNLQIIIANLTDPTYKAPERYSRNFIPILIPIYEAFIEHLEIHPNIIFKYGGLRHNYFERVYWGQAKDLLGNDVKLFNDYLDAIEIQNLKLSLQDNSC